nr:SigE family RNA polymerase sigma factor [Nocardioides sp. Root151]
MDHGVSHGSTRDRPTFSAGDQPNRHGPRLKGDDDSCKEIWMARAYDEEFTAFAVASLADLRRTAYLMCSDWHRAEDAAQEALIRVYRSWHRVERREGLLAYARRTTIRILIDDSRRPVRRERSVDIDDHHVAGIPAPDGGIVERDAMVRALSELTPRRRACVVLRYYHQLSVAETAAALGCSEGTVKSQTSDALRALRPLLATDDVETGPRR